MVIPADRAQATHGTAMRTAKFGFVDLIVDDKVTPAKRIFTSSFFFKTTTAQVTTDVIFFWFSGPYFSIAPHPTVALRLGTPLISTFGIAPDRCRLVYILAIHPSYRLIRSLAARSRRANVTAVRTWLPEDQSREKTKTTEISTYVPFFYRRSLDHKFNYSPTYFRLWNLCPFRRVFLKKISKRET